MQQKYDQVCVLAKILKTDPIQIVRLIIDQFILVFENTGLAWNKGIVWTVPTAVQEPRHIAAQQTVEKCGSKAKTGKNLEAFSTLKMIRLPYFNVMDG